MRGLNKIFNDIEKIRHRCLELKPRKNLAINEIFNCLLEIYEQMNYENKRGNTRRYRYSKKEHDIPIESLISVINEMLNKTDSKNWDEFVGFLSVLEAKLQQIEDLIKPAIKSINKILKKEPLD